MIKYFIFIAHWNIHHYHLPTASKQEPVSAYIEQGKQFPAMGSDQWPDERSLKEDEMVGPQTNSQEGVGTSHFICATKELI